MRAWFLLRTPAPRFVISMFNMAGELLISFYARWGSDWIFFVCCISAEFALSL